MMRDTKRAEIVERTRQLTDEELQIVAGGRKAGEGQKEFLVVKMQDVIITSVT
jgi:oligoribonuclease (3'-5' exoribonuclease)